MAGGSPRDREFDAKEYSRPMRVRALSRRVREVERPRRESSREIRMNLLGHWIGAPDIVLLIVDMLAYMVMWRDIRERTALTKYDRYWLWIGAPVSMGVELWVGFYLVFVSWLVWWVLRVVQVIRSKNKEAMPVAG
jgi:hypothetical protein